MKKMVGALTAAMLLIMILTGCANAGASGDNIPVDEDRQTLTVGFDQSFPPYGFLADDGSFTGFDLDLARAVCDKNGWNLNLSAIDWDAKDALLGSGSINCLWNGFTMEGREDNYTFSQPYMLNDQVVVAKAGGSVFSLDDLAGKVVMTQVDSAALALLQKPTTQGGQADLASTFKDLQTIGDFSNAFMQLESGMVDAVVCDSSVADYQLRVNPDKFSKFGALSSEHYVVGFKRGDEVLAKQVSDTLKELDREGSVKTLCEKYESYGVSYDNWIL